MLTLYALLRVRKDIALFTIFPSINIMLPKKNLESKGEYY